jgi:hypothetical protein
MWVRRSLWRTAHKRGGRKEVRWCEGRSGTEDRTPLDILVTVELAFGFLKLLPGASTRVKIDET